MTEATADAAVPRDHASAPAAAVRQEQAAAAPDGRAAPANGGGTDRGVGEPPAGPESEAADDRIALPGRTASAAEWSALFDRLGRPADPEGYRLTPPQPGTVPYDPAVEREFRGIAHRLGLLPAQVEGLHDWWLQAARAGHQQAAAAPAADPAARRREAETALRRDWGERFDGELAHARGLVRRYADAGMRGLIEGGLGDDPAFIAFCARIGSALAEDRLPDMAAPLPPTGDARKRIAAVMADRSHPYFNRDDPRHRHAVDEMRVLFETVYGTEGA